VVADQCLLRRIPRGALLEDRQDRRLRLAQRVGERAIAGWLRQGAKVHVESNHGRAGLVKVPQRLCVIAARPGPGADLRHALCINLENRNFTRRSAVEQLRAQVGQPVLERLEGARDEQDEGRRDDEKTRRDALKPVTSPLLRIGIRVAADALAGRKHRAVRSGARG
jgi:hypothetical protein